MPRQGHRVLARAHDPLRGAPLAYVRALSEAPAPDRLHGILIAGMEELAAERGWPLLALSSLGRKPKEVFAQLQSSRVCGVMLDTFDLELLKMVERAGMPAVMIETWRDGVEIDSVIQNNYQGGIQAARYLAERGHKRIAWLGRIEGGFLARERLSGALSGLAEAGLGIPPELRVGGGRYNEYKQAHELLERPDRPTAVLALWRTPALALVQAAGELGLSVGRDVDIVGWTSEEQYDAYYRAQFREDVPPVAIVWSARAMAEAAMTRLVQRRADPGMAAVQIRIPTRLRTE
jgi:DNA-binding LacI/PurR family transcriptional regulator